LRDQTENIPNQLSTEIHHPKPHNNTFQNLKIHLGVKL